MIKCQSLEKRSIYRFDETSKSTSAAAADLGFPIGDVILLERVPTFWKNCISKQNNLDD